MSRSLYSRTSTWRYSWSGHRSPRLMGHNCQTPTTVAALYRRVCSLPARARILNRAEPILDLVVEFTPREKWFVDRLVATTSIYGRYMVSISIGYRPVNHCSSDRCHSSFWKGPTNQMLAVQQSRFCNTRPYFWFAGINISRSRTVY